MTDADRKAIADGRIVAAPKALALHLVDALGYLDDAIAEAERLAGVSGAEVVLFQRSGYPDALDLRDRPQRPAPGRADPVQLSRPRPEQAADLPLPLAARPDPDEARRAASLSRTRRSTHPAAFPWGVATQTRTTDAGGRSRRRVWRSSMPGTPAAGAGVGHDASAGTVRGMGSTPFLLGGRPGSFRQWRVREVEGRGVIERADHGIIREEPRLHVGPLAARSSRRAKAARSGGGHRPRSYREGWKPGRSRQAG